MKASRLNFKGLHNSEFLRTGEQIDENEFRSSTELTLVSVEEAKAQFLSKLSQDIISEDILQIGLKKLAPHIHDSEVSKVYSRFLPGYVTETAAITYLINKAPLDQLSDEMIENTGQKNSASMMKA